MSIVKRTIDKEAQMYAHAFRDCIAKGKLCFQSLTGMTRLSQAVQLARGEILALQGEVCAGLPNALAPAEPISECGDKIQSRKNFRNNKWVRPIERVDLHCDAISWQQYELNSPDNFGSECPHYPEKPALWNFEDVRTHHAFAGRSEEQEEHDDM